MTRTKIFIGVVTLLVTLLLVATIGAVSEIRRVSELSSMKIAVISSTLSAEDNARLKVFLARHGATSSPSGGELTVETRPQGWISVSYLWPDGTSVGFVVPLKGEDPVELIGRELRKMVPD